MRRASWRIAVVRRGHSLSQVKKQKSMDGHESIMFWAFRYALGRHTYAVSDVADYLIIHKDKIGAATKARICREIKEHFEEYGDGGWECDKLAWDGVVRAFSDPAQRTLLDGV